MRTRKDYLNSKCTHSQYYAQFVDTRILARVRSAFGESRLQQEFKKDESFNGIPLASWDRLAESTVPGKGLREAGDYPTLAGKVCILKEAARQIATS